MTEARPHLIAVATTKGVALYRGETMSVETTPSWDATSISLSPSGDEVAVGATDSKCYVMAIGAGDALADKKALEHRGAITCVAYSPNGAHLAVADAERFIMLYARSDWTTLVTADWRWHTTRPTAIAWSPNSAYLASGSSDESIYIWTVADTKAKTQLKYAHKDGVTALGWLTDDNIVSAGGDGCVVSWKRA